jgi:hypothetical protein
MSAVAGPFGRTGTTVVPGLLSKKGPAFFCQLPVCCGRPTARTGSKCVRQDGTGLWNNHGGEVGLWPRPSTVRLEYGHCGKQEGRGGGAYITRSTTATADGYNMAVTFRGF